MSQWIRVGRGRVGLKCPVQSQLMGWSLPPDSTRSRWFATFHSQIRSQSCASRPRRRRAGSRSTVEPIGRLGVLRCIGGTVGHRGEYCSPPDCTATNRTCCGGSTSFAQIDRALAGETFTETRSGTMAPSIRAETPVRDGDRIVGTGGAGGRYLGTDLGQCDVGTAVDCRGGGYRDDACTGRINRRGMRQALACRG